jgi:hypothetical protein
MKCVPLEAVSVDWLEAKLQSIDNKAVAEVVELADTPS